MNEIEFRLCIKGIQSSNKESLKDIYDCYANSIYMYALTIVKNESLAEDICQDVFIKIWRNSNKYKIKSNHKIWLMTITKNTSIDYLRKYKKESVYENKNKLQHDILNEVDQINDKIYIDQILKNLEQDECEIIMLHIVSDLTFKNIGVLLNKPLGTITWKYRKAIEKLRKILSL